MGNTTDYNGYRPNRGIQERYRYFKSKSGPNVSEPKKEDWQIFSTLKEFQTGTGEETHSVEVDFDIFEKLSPPDHVNRYAVYHAMDRSTSINADGRRQNVLASKAVG